MKKQSNILKRLFSLLIFLLFLLFTGCSININLDPSIDDPNPSMDDPTEVEDLGETEFTLYSINDFHGCIFENGDQAGISKIGEYLIDAKENDPDHTLIISAGDMFQGTAVSSMTRGKAVVEVMNYIGFDAMTIGNHEWDWGIDEVLKYQDKDYTNGEANFPFLIANITDSSGKLPSWAVPYTIIEKGGYKFGVIGIIGSDQKKDILASYTEGFTFTDELTAIKKYTKVLREEKGADFVILSCHCDTTSFNTALASLTGSYKVDVILNGHTHQSYYGIIENSTRNCGVPYVQSGSYGKYVGKITLRVNNASKEIIFSDSVSLQAKFNCKVENSQINAIIDGFSQEIAVASEEVGVSALTLYQSEGGAYCANVLRFFDDGDLGVCNSGGIRGNAFPINSGDTITYGDVFEMMPFENKVVLVSIKGIDLLKIIEYSGLFFSDNVDTKKKTINGEAIDSNRYYRVATIDYLFEKTSYPFKTGRDIVISSTLFRDAIFNAMKENVKKNGKFYWNRW